MFRVFFSSGLSLRRGLATAQRASTDDASSDCQMPRCTMQRLTHGAILCDVGSQSCTAPRIITTSTASITTTFFNMCSTHVVSIILIFIMYCRRTFSRWGTSCPEAVPTARRRGRRYRSSSWCKEVPIIVVEREGFCFIYHMNQFL